MKPSDILQFLFILSVIVFLAGLMGDPVWLKPAVLALSLIGVAAIALSWGTLPSLTATSRQALLLALADTFVFLLFVLTALFLLKGFIFTTLSLDFGIFSTLFLSILMVRLLSLKVMGK